MARELCFSLFTKDLQDLGNVRDLNSFVKAEKALGSRSGKLINFSDIARIAGISSVTVRKYLNYLSLSYQVFELQPFTRNIDKRLSKMEKIVFTDIGVLKTINGIHYHDSGAEFETFVISEIIKQLRSSNLKLEFSYLRTNDGREVDLLIENDKGFFAIEIKASHKVSKNDTKHLQDLDKILDRPLLFSFVISMDDEIKFLGENILAVPVGYFLGP